MEMNFNATESCQGRLLGNLAQFDRLISNRAKESLSLLTDKVANLTDKVQAVCRNTKASYDEGSLMEKLMEEMSSAKTSDMALNVIYGLGAGIILLALHSAL
ncbi:MAG: hypothetical protein NC328_04900 [Muribaculum sp.]|nr:hypothetical protein [Muribaculum sp.]